jgi:hypothetical protein
MRSEILTMLITEITVFWNMLQCTLVDWYKYFGVTYCLLLQDNDPANYMMSHPRKKQSSITYKRHQTHHNRGWTTHLPSMVLGWAVNKAGSKMNRVLSTTRVIRSSLTGVMAKLEDVAAVCTGSMSLFIWFLAGPSEWCCVRDLHYNRHDASYCWSSGGKCYAPSRTYLPVSRGHVKWLLGGYYKVWSLIIWNTSALSLH